MMRKMSQKGLPAQVKIALSRFKQWRKKKKGREQIPLSLWEAAVKLSHKYGVCRVSQWLRLNDSALRDRVREQSAVATDPESAKKKPAHSFVELVSPAHELISTVRYVVEAQNIRVHVTGACPEQVAALAKLLGSQHQ